MVVENVTFELAGLVGKIGNIALWLQAIGIVAAILIIAELVSFYLNFKRYRQLLEIRTDVRRIEGKINKILGKRR